MPSPRAQNCATAPYRARSTALWVGADPFTVILSKAKNLALSAQDELREGSRHGHFHGNARFFLRYAQDGLRLLRMTVPTGFPESVAP